MNDEQQNSQMRKAIKIMPAAAHNGPAQNQIDDDDDNEG